MHIHTISKPVNGVVNLCLCQILALQFESGFGPNQQDFGKTDDIKIPMSVYTRTGQINIVILFQIEACTAICPHTVIILQ